MMDFLNKIIESGANYASDAEAIKKIILVNKISIVFLLAAIPFMISVYAVNLFKLGILVPFVMLFFMATIICNKVGKISTQYLREK